MRELDQTVVTVVKDQEMLDDFLRQHEFFILKSASNVAKRYVSKSDDEWSVALSAFTEAISRYDYEQGSFLSFAELIIKRRLMDYYKSQSKYNAEVHVEWIEESALQENNENNLKYEIEAIGQVLQSYGFNFMDLSNCSPKAKKTKTVCADIVNYLMDKPILIKEIRQTKQLPVKLIVKNLRVPRKIIERHRKYIVAAVEILHGDYPYLSEYLSYIKERREQDESSRS